MFKLIRHPEIIGAATKYLCFLFIAQQPKLYIASAIVNVYLIWLEVRMRNHKILR